MRSDGASWRPVGRRWPAARQVLLVAAACVLTGVVPAAGADAPDASEPEDAFLGDADRGLVECPADRIRARRELAASGVRIQREAVDVAKITTTQGLNIAGAVYGQRYSDWEVATTARALAGLEERSQALREPDPDEPVRRPAALSQPLCQALASRDPSLCGQLSEASERTPCLAWTALWQASRRGRAGCDEAPPELRAICRAVVSGKAEDCGKGQAAEGCRATVHSLEDVASHCGEGLDVSRCGWGLLGRVLRDGREACAIASPGPGRQTRAHQRTHSVCLAVATEAPERCAATDSTTPPPTPHWVEARTLPTLEGPAVFVVLAIASPGPCFLDLRSDETTPGGAPWHLAASVHQGSWTPRSYRFRLPLAVDPDRGGVVATATCLPGVMW